MSNLNGWDLVVVWVQKEKQRAKRPEPSCCITIERLSGRLVDIVTFFEFINTSSCIYQTLRTGKEWVTFVTDLNTDSLFNTLSFECVSTCTTYTTNEYVWMNIFFHLSFLIRVSKYIPWYIFFKSVRVRIYYGRDYSQTKLYFQHALHKK